MARPSRDSGYTRPVSWRPRIAVVLLFVLAAGPIGATVCAASCDVRESPTMVQHQAAQHCEQLTDSVPAPRMSDTSQHGCSGHQTIDVAVTVGLRADLSSSPPPPADFTCDVLRASVRGVSSALAYASPPGTAPSATTPLILRV